MVSESNGCVNCNPWFSGVDLFGEIDFEVSDGYGIRITVMMVLE
jgi:hypothetical protein